MKTALQIMDKVTTDGIIACGLVAALLVSVIAGSGASDIANLIVSGLIGYMGRVSLRQQIPTGANAISDVISKIANGKEENK